MSRLLTLHDPERAAAYRRRGLWRDETLYDLLAGHAEARGDAYAIRDRSRRLTFRALKRWVDRVADALGDAGLAPGERIAMRLSDRVEAVVVLLAAVRQGLVCNPSLHRNYTVDEIKSLIERIGARLVIAEQGYGVDADRRDVIAPLRDSAGVAAVWSLAVSRKGARAPGPDFPSMDGPARPSVTAVTAAGAAAGAAPASPAASADWVCYLAFTSGTTGAPKGVMHSSNTLLANARDLVADWHHDARDILLTLSPLSHHIAWVAVAQALVAGMELVLNDPPADQKSLDWLCASGATYVMGVPTHAIDLLADQRARGIPRLGDVRVFYMAGAPIPRATAQAFLDQGIAPQNVYGMTENSSHQYTHPDDDAELVVASCGRGGRAYEVRIFDPEDRDRPLPVGETGEIGGRGAALMLGYFDNQAATEGSFNRDGWFMSGDLGRLDEKGCLHIVGRLKDIIIRGGHNIYPGRIEDLALNHPGVDKVAAFAVPDARLGEKLCLAVLPAGDPPPTGDDLLTHLHRAGLSKYDMPEYYLVVSRLPLTASGKIMKRVLADQVRAGALKPTPVRFAGPALKEG